MENFSKDKYALTLGSSGDTTATETEISINLAYFDVNNPSNSGDQPINIPAATTEKAGLMTKDDKVKLNNISDVPVATDSVAGKVKLGNSEVQIIEAQSPTKIEGKTYPIQANSEGQLVVNVPWVSAQGSETTNVTQNGVSETNGSYNLLLGQTAGNTGTETGAVNKANSLIYNPNTKALAVGGSIATAGSITGSQIKKSGGTSSQILMADESVAESISEEDIDSMISSSLS